MTSYLKGKSYEEIYGKEKTQKIKEDKSKSARKSLFYQVEENLNKMNLMLMDDNYEDPESFHNFICLICGEEINTTYKKIKKAKYTCNFCLFNKKDGILDENIRDNLVGRNRYELWKEHILPKLLEKEKVDSIIKRLKEDLNYLMDYIIEDTNFLDENAQIGQRLYHIYHGIYEIPKCEICEDNYVRFSGFYKGYQRYCSQYCGGKAKGKNKLNKESREKLSKNMKNTFKERGGEIIEQRKKTYFEKTGYYHQMHNPEVNKKIRNTMKDNYGVQFPLQNKNILERTQKTNLEKYGEECTLKNPKVIEKTKETNISKYDAEHWAKSDYGKEKLRERGLERHKDNQKRILNELNIEFNDLIEYQNATYYHIWKCLTCGNNFKTTWGDIRDGYRCPHCYPRNQGVSSYEYELREFLESYNLEIIPNSKSIIPPQELDIYVPSKNVAIEINGLYWHSDELITDKLYHLNKTKECEKIGIQLIHIFEDEWVYKRNIVKSRIKQILGVNDAVRLNARSCNIYEIDSKTKNEFLEKFHLQGEDKSVVKLGAYYNNELIAVMTFSRGNIAKGTKNKEGVWELNRFCTNYNYHIPGIGSRLLEFFKRNYNWTNIFSYADRRWSNGNLYYNLGFTYIGETNVNYWYVSNNNRIHRFSLRKSKDDPKEITEWQLRSSEGYNKIWDCGNIKFEIINE